jgi:peptide-methionine (S)-S-oxide reductase
MVKWWKMDTNLRATEKAVFGGGCFWCTEAIFLKLRGVISVMPGYAGGTTPDPTYQDVCSGTTGHAEVIEIIYDPAVISFRDLLTVFFATHDASTLNRQGPDVGPQYRSIILTTTQEQQNEAASFIAEINAASSEGRPIVTDIQPLVAFYPAEADHRNYYAKNSNQPYCQLIIQPKLQKAQERFHALLREQNG